MSIKVTRMWPFERLWYLIVWTWMWMAKNYYTDSKRMTGIINKTQIKETGDRVALGGYAKST
jgi:hypothetical protein